MRLEFTEPVSEVVPGHESFKMPGSSCLPMENTMEISLHSVNLQGLQHHTGERRFSVSAAYDALAGGSKVFPALQLGFLLPVGTHK